MSCTCSNWPRSAGGIACRIASGVASCGAGGLVQPVSAAASIMMHPVREEITAPDLPRHHGNIVLCGPDQRHEPADYAPSQKEVEQKDRKSIPLASGQRDDRRQEIQCRSKAKPEEWGKENS